MPFTFVFNGSYKELYRLFEQLNRFTVRTAPGLIAKSAAWKGYDKASRPLLPVLKKLAGR